MSSEPSTTTGIVQAIDGGFAELEVPVGACSGCGHQAGCGIGRLARGGPIARIRLPAPQGLCAGDAVELAMAPEALARAALQGYLLPALLIVLGAVAGELVHPGDSGAALGALAGLASGLATLYVIRQSGSPAGQPSIRVIRR